MLKNNVFVDVLTLVRRRGGVGWGGGYVFRTMWTIFPMGNGVHAFYAGHNLLLHMHKSRHITSRSTLHVAVQIKC